MGGVPPERCGAGLSPAVALDFDKHVARLERLGYIFEALARAPTGEELEAALVKLDELPK